MLFSLTADVLQEYLIKEHRALMFRHSHFSCMRAADRISRWAHLQDCQPVFIYSF